MPTQKEKRSSCIGFGAILTIPETVYSKTRVIYRVVFDTGLFYIGSTKNMRKRAQAYKYAFAGGLHLSKGFCKAVLCSGSAFIEIVEEVSEMDDLKIKEAYYLSLHTGNNLLINRSSNTDNKGVRWTKEERAKVSDKMIGMVRPESTKEKHRQRALNPAFSMKGRKQSPAHIKNRIESRKKKK